MKICRFWLTSARDFTFVTNQYDVESSEEILSYRIVNLTSYWIYHTQFDKFVHTTLLLSISTEIHSRWRHRHPPESVNARCTWVVWKAKRFQVYFYSTCRQNVHSSVETFASHSSREILFNLRADLGATLCILHRFRVRVAPSNGRTQNTRVAKLTGLIARRTCVSRWFSLTKVQSIIKQCPVCTRCSK